jgi:ribose transport system ATP-binding protein
MDYTDIVLKLNRITKTYPGVVALNDVTLELARGEVHALVGENGAGKSTLIKTCAGAVKPDAGEIYVDGKKFLSMTPQRADKNGISVVYQEFNLVEELTVVENIFLGRALRKGILLDKAAMARESVKLFERLGVNIDPNSLVSELTAGYQQLVEIAKAVSKNAKVLIMDEPSASLTKSEVKFMFSMVRQLRREGVTIVYISHRLDEIFELSDRITILRDGQKIETRLTSNTTSQDLITLMVGRELKDTFPHRTSKVAQEVLLKAEGICGNGLENISFNLHKGEILGFAGLIGAGRTELAELIFGIKEYTGGRLVFKGEEYYPHSPKQAICSGIALVPEDRKRQGVLLHMSILQNISIASLNSFSVASVIKQAAEKRHTMEYQKNLAIKTPSLDQIVKNLSGGNQQKVVLAKWLLSNSDLIIFDEPSRGIDVGAKYEIYKLMGSLIDEGKTIIMISSEMEELIGMADRILVLSEGRLCGELQKNEFDQKRIMQYAS